MTTPTLSRRNLGNQFIRDHEGKVVLLSYNGDRAYVHGEVVVSDSENDCYLVRMTYGENIIRAYYVEMGFALPCTAAASARWEAAARRTGALK